MTNKKTNWADILKSWLMVFSIIGSIVSATIYLKSDIKSTLQGIVNQHDHGYTDPKIGPSHKDLRETITDLQTKLSTTNLQQEADHSDVVMAYWYLIGYAVVDIEPYKQLRASAAAYYRNRFLADCLKTCKELELKRCKINNRPYVQDVYRKTMASKWPERNNLIRSMRLR